MTNAKQILFYGCVVLGLWVMPGLSNAVGVKTGLGNAVGVKTGQGNAAGVKTGQGNAAGVKAGLGNAAGVKAGLGNAAGFMHGLHAEASKTSSADTSRVYLIEILEEIAPGAWRTVQNGIKEAEDLQVDWVVLRINTYGGQVDVADSIRTRLLNTPLRTIAFIDNNAASAGALISIACDSIYMRQSASMGAATVVNQTGEVVPDKYQSYMRAIMRATASTNGRNPRIAEAMVDPSVSIPGVIDSGKVLTFTSDEAIANGFCEGKAERLEDVLRLAGINQPYRIVKQEITSTDRVISWLIHPAVSSILILLILGGLYFELQSPGIGFPLAVSIGAALLYFAPLYLEGLAANWEILLFLAGIILLAVEIFILPGFGVAGATGIVLIVFALVSSLVGNNGFDYELPEAGSGLGLMQAMVVVMLPVVLAFTALVVWGQNLLDTQAFRRLVRTDPPPSTQTAPALGAESPLAIGIEGVALTDLRPVGRVSFDGVNYEARARFGYIEKGERVRLVDQERLTALVEIIVA
jgi:membrane-bound serine protease (ClpP class)